MEEVGQQKVTAVKEHAGKTSPNTAVRGQEVIQREVRMLCDEFDNCFHTVSETQTQLGRWRCPSGIYSTDHVINISLEL